MVDQDIWADLLSYKIPILAVGDHGQLPPIKGSFNLMEKPHLKLEEIHRQAKDNPIIQLSIMARTDGVIKEGAFSKTVKKILSSDAFAREEMEEDLRNFTPNTLILCGYNSTRVKINEFIRNAKDLDSVEPLAKDRVICLRNNRKKKIYNGMTGTIQHIFKFDADWYEAEILMDNDDILYKGLISKNQFNSTEPLNFTKKRGESMKGDLFDFGYCLTVHKAQGSEAEKVILFEERFKQMDDETWKKWLYTGITRAQKDLIIVGS
jgi:exodeoxyribonuclease-5